MKLSEALQILHETRGGSQQFDLMLACGFTPLHLQTYLAAHLQSSLPGRRVEVKTGLYGDLLKTLERLADGDAIAVVVEWADLDPRLGYRSLGGWGPSETLDIVGNVQSSLSRIQSALDRAPAIPLALAMPTLDLPPAFHTPGWEASQAELDLLRAAACFAAEIGSRPSTFVVNPQRLLERSPISQRFDLRSDLSSGFPYTLGHADMVGEALARLIAPPAAKKGLITDLDETFWKGIVGEDGPETVSWDLAGHSQIHGLYQQVLKALAGQGALIGVASKNDPAVVDRAFERTDLLIGKENIFPIEANWDAKSKSVGRILRTWNIGAGSVVFVDDSALELAEVKAAFPDIEAIQFDKRDHAAGERLLRRLRDLFGKRNVSSEDALRLGSIRQAAGFQAGANGIATDPEDFLAKANARIVVEFAASDSRALELVNKTNQFNLNGGRKTEVEWRRELAEPGAFSMAVSYKDKYGALGKIAVIRGLHSDGVAEVRTWVMSCRAFSRRIEHRCLEILFERFGVEEVRFDFLPTPKNDPISEFFRPYVDTKPAGTVSLSRQRFREKLPRLYHEVEYVNG